jgi:lysozyme family protein
MARSNFNAVMDEIFRHEGGMSMVRADPGNWTGGRVGVGELRGTNMGIAAHAHPDVDIPNLTKSQAREIYRRQYWNPVRGDDLPKGIDLVTMDPAVNSGVSRGVRWLQQALGVTTDARMGAETLAAAIDASPVPVIQRACQIRMGFLRGLKTFTTFGRGWSRRVAEVEAKAVSMALSAGAGSRPRAELITQEQAAEARSKNEGQIATGVGTTGSAGGAGAVAFDIPMWIVFGGAVVLIFVIVNLIGRARHDTERAKAYQKAAIEVGP